MKKLLLTVSFLIIISSCTPSGIVGSPTLQTTGYTQDTTSFDPATVHIWTSWEGAVFERLQQAVDVYQTTYPMVSFEIQFIPMDRISSEYRSAVENGGGPEILIAPGSLGGDLFHAGLAADIYPFLGSEMEAALQPVAFRSAAWNDTLVGVPLVMSGVIMYRNTSIIQSAPTTVEELKQFSSAATLEGKTGVYLDGAFLFTGGHLFGMGAELMNLEGTPAFINERGSAWLSLIEALRDLGPLAFNSDEDLDAFLKGNTGIIFDGTWNLNRIREGLGEDNLAIDPWPAVEGGHLSGFVQTDNAYLNPMRVSQAQTAPLEFLRFLISPQGQSILFQAGQIPVHRSLEVSDPLMNQVKSAFEAGTAVPIDPVMNSYYSPLNTALQRLFYEDWSIEDILMQAEQDVLRDLEQ